MKLPGVKHGYNLINCPICQLGPLRPRFDLGTHKIAGCGSCGVLFNQTYYEDETFRRGLFDKDYYESVQSEAFKSKLDSFREDPSVRVFKKYLDLIEKETRPGNVLDVGCAFGTFLKVAQERGWRPSGVELSGYASDLTRKTWGFEIFNGDLNDSPFQPAAFDLVTFWDTIEHVKTPKENLKKAHALLKPGGVLLITTDNFQSLIARLAAGLYCLSFGKLKFAVKKFYIPHNTCYFNPEDVKRLLGECRFKLLHFEGIDYPLEKMNLSPLEKIVVGILYKAGGLARLNSQFLAIAQKQ